MKAGLIQLLALVALTGCFYPGKNAPRRADIQISGHPPDLCLVANYRNELFKPSYMLIRTMTPDGEKAIWGHGFSDAETQWVRPTECVPLPGHSPINMLRPRVAYHIVIRNQVGLSRFFVGEFCLVGKPGHYAIHQVHYEKKIGGKNWKPCNLLFPPHG